MNLPYPLERRLPAILIFLWIVGILFLYTIWVPFVSSNWFDNWDFEHYFKYSQWAVGQGTLYKDVYSDYLLLPNLIFGVFHAVAEVVRPLPTSFQTFTWLWFVVGWGLYLWVAYLIYTRVSKAAIWIWLAPGPLYFTMFRYEIYLVVLTFFFLLALRQGKYLKSTLWLGFVIALKGYGLFLIPVYTVYLWRNCGLKMAVQLVIVALSPFILSHVVVWLYAGMDGVIMPYGFQANRPNTRETLYSAVHYLLLRPGVPEVSARLGQGLQVLSALIAAAMRPKTFEEFLDAALFSLVGFVSFGAVNSPQFFLWFTPMTCFSSSRKVRLLSVSLSWLMFLSYPVAQYMIGSKVLSAIYLPLPWKLSVATLIYQLLFRPLIVVITTVRFLIMYINLRRLQPDWFRKRASEKLEA